MYDMFDVAGSAPVCYDHALKLCDAPSQCLSGLSNHGGVSRVDHSIGVHE